MVLEISASSVHLRGLHPVLTRHPELAVRTSWLFPGFSVTKDSSHSIEFGDIIKNNKAVKSAQTKITISTGKIFS